jgi:hypothetical protein
MVFTAKFVILQAKLEAHQDGIVPAMVLSWETAFWKGKIMCYRENNNIIIFKRLTFLKRLFSAVT